MCRIRDCCCGFLAGLSVGLFLAYKAVVLVTRLTDPLRAMADDL